MRLPKSQGFDASTCNHHHHHHHRQPFLHLSQFPFPGFPVHLMAYVVCQGQEHAFALWATKGLLGASAWSIPALLRVYNTGQEGNYDHDALGFCLP